MRRVDDETSGPAPAPPRHRRDEGAVLLEFELTAVRLAALQRSAGEAHQLVLAAAEVVLAQEGGGDVRAAAHAFGQSLGEATNNALLAQVLEHLSATAIVRDPRLLATHYPRIAEGIVAGDGGIAANAVQSLFDDVRGAELHQMLGATSPEE